MFTYSEGNFFGKDMLAKEVFHSCAVIGSLCMYVGFPAQRANVVADANTC